MDLIYTDQFRKDMGVLHNYTFDLAFGKDENNFELTLDVNNHCCDADCFIYAEGTEYGGIIDSINVITKDQTLIYKGRTWHGILASKIIEPPADMSYLNVWGEAHSIIKTILGDLGLLDLFDVPDTESDVRISYYTFERYVDGYTGLTKMLFASGGKLKFTFTNGKVILSAVPLVDYSKNEQFDNDQVEMDIERTYNFTNHLICLGEGELTARTVLHLYKNESGKISKNKTFTGLQEITAVYDYPNAESPTDLEEKGIEKFKEDSKEDNVKMDFAAEETIYDIGDIVGAKEITTGIFATEKITKKIVTINHGVVNINYEVGG